MSEQLKNRMQLFEVTPPPAAWQKIAERLDDDIRYLGISGCMQQYEVTPPPEAWSQVYARITAPPEEHLPLSRKRFPVFFRIATAAAIAAGILLGFWVFNRQPAAITAVPVASGNAVPAAAAPRQPAPETPVPAVAVSPVKITNGDAPVQTTATTLPRPDTAPDENTGRALKYATAAVLPASPEYPIIINAAPIKDASGAVIRNMDLLSSGGSYLIISGPNGHMTRISSKFASVIRYLNNDGSVEENLDKVIRESGAWKKRFSQWRKIISESGFIPSSANFLDIAEFKDLAEGNR